MDQDGFEIYKCISHVDDGWKPVTKQKRNWKQKRNRKQNAADNVFGSLEEQDEDRIQGIPAEKTYVEADEIAERKENLKAEETKKAELSFLQAMEKIDASKLSIYLAKSAVRCMSSPAWQLTGLLDCVGDVLTRVEVPWVKMFNTPSLSQMFDFPLSQIPEPFYDTIVKWIKDYDVCLRGSFVMWGSDLLLEHLVATQRGREGRITCRSKDAIFFVLAILLRWNPFSLIVALPSLNGQGQEKIPVVVLMIAQISQGDLSLGLYSWVKNLLPVAASEVCNSKSRELILQLVEK